MKAAREKRTSVGLSKEETDVLKWLFIKTLLPLLVTVLVSSSVLYFGFEFLIRKITFANYGLAPGSVSQSVSTFISTYIFIAVINLLLMIFLSVTVTYTVLRHVVLPILRINREIGDVIESKQHIPLIVRGSDRLLVPLVRGINVLISKASFK